MSLGYHEPLPGAFPVIEPAAYRVWIYLWVCPIQRDETSKQWTGCVAKSPLCKQSLVLPAHPITPLQCNGIEGHLVALNFGIDVFLKKTTCRNVKIHPHSPAWSTALAASSPLWTTHHFRPLANHASSRDSRD